ncbi:MAG TPA: helix-turn-helix domain-containing protein [Aldersonia sp.]
MADLVRAVRDELRRVGLLGEIRAEGVVPDLILRSWRRSIGNSVESTSLAQRYQDVVDTETLLYRAAAPVLDRWQQQLTDTGTMLFLSDRAGSIVARRTSDTSVRRRLDRAHAAEGFDFSEDAIGTNGLGTSMIERRAVYIQGSQHYNDALADIACAAAPVCTPAGTVIGSVSLGGAIEVANPLMLSLTREIGQQIEERLRAASRPEDLALAMSFMRYTNSRRPTVVMDHESLLANTPGLPYVSVTSHVLLWELLNDHDWSRAETTRILLDGNNIEVSARRVLDGRRAHFVLHFAELAEHATVTVDPVPVLADTMVKDAPKPKDSGIQLVEGPRGSGRASMARDLHAERTFEVVTVSSASATSWVSVGDLLAGGTDVLLRRVEEVPERDAEHVWALVQAHRAAVASGAQTSLLLLTADRDRAVEKVRAVLDEIELPARTAPLAETRERIPVLVRTILDRVDPDGRHTLSPAALQALVQYSWPGNITELVDTITVLVAEVSTSVIEARHLPKHLRQAPPRRQLSLIEAAEREAIIKALDASGGNKSEAAALLGIGRTTLYRRLRQLGLDADEGTL